MTGATRGTALVTGAGRGLGRALAAGLWRAGHPVVVADLDGDAAATTAAELGPGAQAATLDVRDGEAVAALVDRLDADGGLEVLVNNAGVAPREGGPDGLYPAAQWQRVLDVNVLGVVHGVNAAYPRFRARGRGAILNVASLAGLVPSPGLGPYTAAKHAVVGLTAALRADARGRGVRVTALCPGWVDTDMLDVPGPDGRTARELLGAFRAGRAVPAAQVAQAALAGLHRDRALVVVPSTARALWRLHRFAPAVADAVVARTARRLAAR